MRKSRHKVSIHVVSAGRLGNQLFQAAALKTLLGMLNTKGTSQVRIVWYFADSVTRQAVRILNLSESTIYFRRWKLVRTKSPIGQQLLRIPYSIFIHYLNHKSYKLPERYREINQFRIVSIKKIVLDGFYQDFSYVQVKEYKGIKIYEESETNKKEISVGMHLRFGDFLNQSLILSYGRLSRTYYQMCIDSVVNAIENSSRATFHIFTDELIKAKEFLKQVNFYDSKVEFVRDLDYSDIEEMEFFASMDFLILSNSTFSWWAGYLSSRAAGIFAPLPLLKNGSRAEAADPNWIRIPGYQMESEENA
jgi:hypothetical protein